MAVTPFLGYNDDDIRDGDDKPFLIKYLIKEKRYDTPELNLEAPSGTSIFTNSVEKM